MTIESVCVWGGGGVGGMLEGGCDDHRMCGVVMTIPSTASSTCS